MRYFFLLNFLSSHFSTFGAPIPLLGSNTDMPKRLFVFALSSSVSLLLIVLRVTYDSRKSLSVKVRLFMFLHCLLYKGLKGVQAVLYSHINISLNLARFDF